MNRRRYLDLITTGIGAAVTGSIGSRSFDEQMVRATEEGNPTLADFLVREELLRDGYELVDEPNGINLGASQISWQRGDRPSLHYAGRSFGLFGGEESAPAEVTSRAFKLGHSEKLTALQDELLEWILLDRYGHQDPTDHDFTGWVESSTEERRVNGHQRMTLWVRLPLLRYREDLPQPENPPAKPYHEYATTIQITPWGGFETTVSVEYPAERGQTHRTVQRLAEWQSRIVESCDEPVLETEQ